MIFKLIKKLFDKYNSLRQEAWTHWLVLFTYLYVLPINIWYIYIISKNLGYGYIDYPVFYTFIAFPYYICPTIVCLIFGLINRFTKKKIKNNFLTQNKFYAAYWHFGNILFLEFVIFLILTIYAYARISTN